MWHDSLMWLVHKRHDSFTYATWRTHMRNTTYYLFTSGVKMIGLFCKRDLSKRRYSAKETYNFKGLTNHSHPIATWPITYLSAGNDRYIFDMTHSYVPWLIHTCHDLFISGKWQIYHWCDSFIYIKKMCDIHMNITYICHDPFIGGIWGGYGQ